MATNILTPMASPSYEPNMTANNDSNTTPTNPETSDNSATGSTESGGLRRSNTLKAYLANKNKMKERQAINVIVDPTVIQRGESSASENDLSPLSPQRTLMSPDGGVFSPVSGRRIDADLEALDNEKRLIEGQLAAVTQRLQSPPSSPTSAPVTTASGAELPPLPDNLTKDELIAKRTRLCEDLDALVKKRRELLQSWTRDYKNLKRSGSLAKRQEDLLWVTTA
ncbi:hypothetical protein BGZ65_012132 [Modicella reniformis]|uniref:Uncharacterized protein n=1 Tax=Modicella reniformis TaxID=1440133 RepID=A0A9P6SUP8_9FUNG|nr:hypothetical protein BGZ65_012132 [Modicella reniformis]